MGRARRGADPLGRHLLRLSRADTRGRRGATGRVRASGGRVLPAGHTRRGADRASGRVLLRALPRRIRAIRPEGRRDLGRDDAVPFAHPARDVPVRRRRAARAAGHRARLRPPQSRSALAGAPRAERPEQRVSATASSSSSPTPRCGLPPAAPLASRASSTASAASRASPRPVSRSRGRRPSARRRSSGSSARAPASRP